MAQPTAKVEKGNLIITVPLNPAEPSNSGKTMLVASQRFITEQPLVDGKNLTIQVNAYYKPTAG